jgi:hypothetical protein
MAYTYERLYLVNGTQEQVGRLLPALMALRESRSNGMYHFTVAPSNAEPGYLEVTALFAAADSPRGDMEGQTEVLEKLEATGCTISSPKF